MNRFAPWLAGIAAAVLTAFAAHGRSTPYNNFVLLAQAFVHGRVAIDWPGPYIDALGYGPDHFVIEGPFPAVLLMPFVALFGSANQTLLAIVLAGVAIGFCWLACDRLGVAPRTNALICVFAFAGTQLWWAAMLGDVWMIAHVAAVACTFVALAEVVGPRRGWIVGLGAVAAVFSRFALVLAIPVYAFLLVHERDPQQRRRALIGFGGACLAGALLWVAYNEARWSTWYDIGYTAWYHQDAAGSPTGSPFQLRYLGYEIQSFFFAGPSWKGQFPYAVPEFTGVALTYVSPALIIAFWARRPRALVASLWVATALVAGPSFIYYVNGFAQFGMRHALDFEPFLVLLMALGIGRVLPVASGALIAWSVLASTWGVWYWDTFVRPNN